MVVIVSKLPRKMRAEVQKMFGLPPPVKYGNTMIKLNGHTFGSLKERDRYLVLLMRQKIGEISGLEIHPRFKLEVNGRVVGTYIADSSYYENHGLKFIVEDVKSRPTRTAMYRRNKKLMKAIHGIDIKEVM
jgi:hypothetical protein